MSLSSFVYSAPTRLPHWLLLPESPPLLASSCRSLGFLHKPSSLLFLRRHTFLHNPSMQRRSTPSIAPPSSWYPIPQNQTTLPPCIPSTFSFSLHTNEDKISHHSSIEAVRLTLISGASVHCTTTELLFGHPMFGHICHPSLFEKAESLSLVWRSVIDL